MHAHLFGLCCPPVESAISKMADEQSSYANSQTYHPLKHLPQSSLTMPLLQPINAFAFAAPTKESGVPSTQLRDQVPAI